MPRLGSWVVPLLVFVVIFTTFLPALQNDFVNWDDYENLVENQHYRGLGWKQLRWMFTNFQMGHYQPLSWMTFGLDYLLWGMDPAGYHLTSVLLHGINAVLFYFIVVRLLPHAFGGHIARGDLGLRLAAGFAALFFAVHPLRVESVAWATERRDVLSGLFFLGTILCYLRATAATDAKSAYLRWMSAAVMLYVFSLLSKAVGMTLPIILLVLDVYPLRRLGGVPRKWLQAEVRGIWIEKIPFLLVAVTCERDQNTREKIWVSR